MSDKERLMEMFSRAGIEFKLNPATPDRNTLKLGAEKSEQVSETLCIEEGIGYTGFWCEFIFDAQGNLLGHGVWE
jgi:hypothetical protein